MCVIMLAHNGLALITEKLQKQRLEEFPPAISGNHISVTTSLTGATSQQQDSLTVKGKNVWSLSLETERQRLHERATQDVIKSSPPSAVKTQLSYLRFCRHDQLQRACESCDTTSGAAAAPPKKKRCRSLSGPPECLTAVSAASVGEYVGKVWKPIAVIPPQSSNDIVSTRECESSNWSPHKTTSFKQLPVNSSHCSTECGCYTSITQTSSQVCCTNSTQSSSSGCCTNSANTSSSSPIPRPASAASDMSFSSIWQETPKKNRVRILENRSLSCEDQISGSCCISSASTVVQDERTSCHDSSLPRCHSQPCILHHRRCAKKRRRDFHRPALNFHKMTETAYVHSHEPMQTESSDIPAMTQQIFADGCVDTIFDHNSNDSSSLDFEFPSVTRDVNTDLSNPASLALPATPPMFTTANCVRCPSTRGQEEVNERWRAEVQEENKRVYQRDFSYESSQTHARIELFTMTDLDLLEIESH